MERKNIIDGLREKGYIAEPFNKQNNGVIFEGIVIKNNTSISPVIYVGELIEKAGRLEAGIDEVVNSVIVAYHMGMMKKDTESISDFFDREFVYNHIYIGLQRVSAEKLEKRDIGLDGIEAYLYVRSHLSEEGGFSRIKVKPEYRERFFESFEDAWKCAERNTFAETSLKKMDDVLQEAGLWGSCDIPVYVLSNTCNVQGASAVLNKKVISEFAIEHGVKKIVVLPSSIHEVLIIPYEEGMEIEYFTSMVMGANDSAVAEEEQLSDRAYILNV